MNIRTRIAAQRGAFGAYFAGTDGLRAAISSAFWLASWLTTGLVLALSAKQGADFPRYECWSDALSRGDIFQIYSLVASPLGLPLSVHSAGPGMLLSVGRAWFGWLGLHLRPDYLFMGLAALAAWWALLRLTLRLTTGNVPVTAFVLGVGFVGTHLGYYSGAYSSELASFFALSILCYFAVGSLRIGLFEALIIGVTSGLAIVIRTQLALYVVLPCAVAAWRVHTAHGRSRRAAGLALAALAPCLILLVEAAYVNRWMTGSFLHTPYQFGDGQWQSVDWRRAEFRAVLVNPRHGLLTYHPLYAIGFACAVYLAATANDWAHRAIASAAIAITLLHWYLQAAWFCWWLGTGTFGMRGMATLAVLLLPALAVVLDQQERAGRAIWPLVVGVSLAGAWSMLLYFQGETNFNTWAELWKAQSNALLQPFVSAPTLVALVVGLASWLLWRRTVAPGMGALAGVAVGLAMTGAAHAWVQKYLRSELHWSRNQAGWGWAAAVGLITAGCCCAIAMRARVRRTPRATELLVGGFVLAFVISASFQFQRLARHTEAYVRDRPPSPRHFEVTSAVLWDEIEASYEEYKLIPGFAGPKERFWAYLERHDAEWEFVRRLRPPAPPAKPRRKRARPK